MQPRQVLAGILALLSALSLASGGFLSPAVFGVLALLAFSWPRLPFASLGSRLVPVQGTILLRSSLVPFAWHSVAEVKPGAEDLPRALSSYEGKLVIMKQGVVYAHARALALDARTAEAKITAEFRRMAGSVPPGGAYLLPLDSSATSKAFSTRAVPVPAKGDVLAGPAPDMLVLEASGGLVTRSRSYAAHQGTPGTAAIPGGALALRDSPLTWEALDSLGKKLRWPEPDPFSNFLQSFHASRNEPLSERLGALESSGGTVKVRALPGDDVELSRGQLRAIMSIYG